MKKRQKLYLSLILAACSLNAYATQVGNIDDFDGALTDYTIKRGIETIQMGVYEPLYPGDRIHISDNHSIDIRQCGEIHKITHKESPYRVQSKKCKVIGLTDNIWLAMKDFGKYIFTIVPNPSVGVHLQKSEEEPPAMPMLESTFGAIPTLKAGKRALALQWFGGKSPYKVQITTAKKEVWETETKAQSVKTGEIHLEAEQTYWIIITANHAKDPLMLKREFETVAKLPDYPKLLQDNTLPENMRRTLQAGWLAKQDRIQWSFESYQQVFDIADNYGPARVLREALRKGN
ncbi:MAG: hypothetical protein KAI83_14010 [Thiomargarita sp.]|nr:hypothetical protein [Thiomargarita sp.]